jgi:iron complex transport system ATP-binding protein
MYFGFERITVSYGKHAVLSDVTLEVPRGSITVLIGRNGCGKSSLLKTVSRAVKPKAGRVILEGRSLMAYTPRQLAKRIAYLGQAVPMPSDIDVETLVSYGRYPHTAPGRGITAHDRDVIDRVLRQTGLEAIRNRTLTTLSGGELQRARIAMNLAQEPSVLILDEPTTHLDLGYQLELLELLRRLNRTLGLTVLMVLHDINLAARYADMIYVIHDGGVAASGAPDDVITDGHMRDVFGIEAQILRDEINGCPYVRPQTALREEER